MILLFLASLLLLFPNVSHSFSFRFELCCEICTLSIENLISSLLRFSGLSSTTDHVIHTFGTHLIVPSSLVSYTECTAKIQFDNPAILYYSWTPGLVL